MPAAQVVKPSTYNNNTQEGKAAKAFINLVNLLSFDPKAFAWIVGQSGLAVEKRVLSSLIAVIDLLSDRADLEMYSTNEEFEFLMAAKRAKDSMQYFRDNGML